MQIFNYTGFNGCGENQEVKTIEEAFGLKPYGCFSVHNPYIDPNFDQYIFKKNDDEPICERVFENTAYDNDTLHGNGVSEMFESLKKHEILFMVFFKRR